MTWQCPDTTAPQCASFAAALSARDLEVLRACHGAIAWAAAEKKIILLTTNFNYARCIEMHLSDHSSARLPYAWRIAIAPATA
jgi:hypothetical protein